MPFAIEPKSLPQPDAPSIGFFYGKPSLCPLGNMNGRLIVLQNRTYSRFFVALALLLFLGGVATTSPTLAQSDPLQTAVSWLISTHQNEDGGFTSFSTGANQAPSDIGGTLDALQAIAAAGGDTHTPLAYLRAQGSLLSDYARTDGGSAGKALLALSAAGADPRSFAGQDLTRTLTETISPTGEYNTNAPYAQAVAILGLLSVPEYVADTAVTWLQNRQAADGSWDDGFGTAANVDATAMAIMALVAVGVPADSPDLTNAGDFLRQARQANGWEYATGFGPNANSTALALQALSALGDDVSAYQEGLLAWQSASGAFQADFGSGPFDDFFTTVQAIPALTGRPYPLNLTAENAPTAVNAAPDVPDAAVVIGWVAAGIAAAALFVAIVSALRRRRTS